MVTLSSVGEADVTGQATSLRVTIFSAAAGLNPVPVMVTTVFLGPLKGEMPEIIRGISSRESM
jgi:hypothetical protein